MKAHTPFCFASATLLTVASIIGLGGCASSPKSNTAPAGMFDGLYDGKSAVAYATELPVSSAAEAIQLGDSALSSGDLDKALFQYIRALKKDGANADALYKIGLVHSSRHNVQLAEAAYRWALREQPDHAGALGGLGIVLLRQRKYEEAQSNLRAAVRIVPNSPAVHNALGVLADMRRDYGRAQEHYQEALRFAKDSPEVLNNLGYSRYLSGNSAGAIAAFQDALRADPGYQRAWRNLGLVYARNKEYEKALDAFTKVQDLPKAYNDVGYVAMLGGQLSEADSFFQEAMRLSPRYYELAGLNEQRLRMLRDGHKTASR